MKERKSVWDRKIDKLVETDANVERDRNTVTQTNRETEGEKVMIDRERYRGIHTYTGREGHRGT